ncbi:MAG TPA: SusC/RagA family TonB-linked outer membrane protein [Prolixibacteraceae bacterium]|nr:SusC/RagA family TonB-linked outer membrane protein [Prolixibacteraceae bacterium]
MKQNYWINGRTTSFQRWKAFLIMKLISVFILGFMMQSYAIDSQSKDKHLTLQFENNTLKEVLQKLESQTEFSFIYKDELINSVNKVSGNFRDEKVTDLLNEILKNTGLTYTIKGRTIIIISNDTGTVMEQQKSITGKVTDSAGSSLPGVTVVVKGTSIGIISDANGNYSISNLPENATLQFSFVGMKTQEIAVGGRTTINVTLSEEAIAIDEVVAIGYGVQKKTEVTTAIANVKSENFVKGAVNDAGQLLQGKVAGLTIVNNSGDPTSNSQILLRGTATLSTSTQPYVLIDGIPGDLNTVAPEDIESIDVLKDGSSAAIYGTRGTNGVILITTRRAKGNDVSSIEYNAYVSTQQISKKPDLLSASDYRNLIAQGVNFQDMGASTDWIDAITRSPFSHVHNLTIRGGNSKTNFIASGVYRSVEGLIRKTDNQTMNGRFDLNHNMYDGKLLFNFGFLSSNNKYTATTNGSGFDGTTYRQALNRNPTEPIKNADGSWYERPSLYFYDNPLARLYETDGENTSSTTRLNGSVTWRPVEGLVFKALVSQQKYNQLRGYSENFNNMSNIRDKKHGFASRGTSQTLEKMLDLTIDYSKSIGDHNFTALAGYSYLGDIGEGFYADNYNFPTDAFTYNNLGIGQALQKGFANMSSYKYTNNLIAFFGRINYNYKERYLFMASLRREASSKFLGAKQPWGNFPAASIGWRINKEEFMSNLTFINDLKFRAGYGVTGTAPDQSFLGVSRLGYQGSFMNNGAWSPTLVPVSNPNPYLKWEEKHEANIGIDFSLFNGRVGGSIDYYNRRTKGLLYDYPVPSPPNLYNTTTANVGTMENKGLEVMVNLIPIKTKDFTWSSSLSFSTNNNKLISLSNDLYKLSNDYFDVGYLNDGGGWTNRVQVGQKIGNFYGFKVVDVTTDGKWIYQLPDGSRVNYDDFTKTDENKMILGNGLPKYYAGWNNTFRYKKFDLGITMRGAFAFQILNAMRVYYENPQITAYNQLKTAHNKVFGKAVLNVPEVEWNSYYLENGDYWKIDNITLGYNFKTSSFKYIKDIRVYASSLNTMVITGYTGMDPEVNSMGLNPGTDERDRYPSTRTFTVGINVTF